MKKKQKNLGVKIVAGLALIAIIIGIVGTGALVLTSLFASPSTNSPQDISPEAIQDVLDISDQSEVIGNESGTVIEEIDSPTDNIESEETSTTTE